MDARRNAIRDENRLGENIEKCRMAKNRVFGRVSPQCMAPRSTLRDREVHNGHEMLQRIHGVKHQRVYCTFCPGKKQLFPDFLLETRSGFSRAGCTGSMETARHRMINSLMEQSFRVCDGLNKSECG